ncbi:MAG: hypothetical protein NC307_15375 [Roseburia sp.]|nr:hypothetical protein [Roseburia sp.]
MTIGNIVGSNIFNILFVVGLFRPNHTNSFFCWSLMRTQ